MDDGVVLEAFCFLMMVFAISMILRTSTTRTKKESLLKLAVYSCLIGSGLIVLYRANWSIFDGVKLLEDTPPGPDVKAFYLYQLVVYIASVPSLLLLEEMTRDRNLLAIHHVLAIILISVSYLCNLWRIGVLVAVSHEISDVTVELYRLSKGTEWCIAVLSIHFLQFVVLRIVYFVAVVLRASFILAAEKITAMSHPLGHWILYFFSNSLLLLLLVATGIWTYNIGWILYRMWSRSEDEL